MGTRCAITLKTKERDYILYNQFDGYLSYTGMKCIEIVNQADAIKTKITDIEIFEKSSFKDRKTVENFENRVKNFDLIFPEWKKPTGDEKEDRFLKQSFRLYDIASEVILGIADGRTNFLVTDTMEEMRNWIDYNYVIDLENKTVEEISRGYFFDTEACETIDTNDRDFFDTLERSFNIRNYPYDLDEEEEYLDEEELNRYLA